MSLQRRSLCAGLLGAWSLCDVAAVHAAASSPSTAPAPAPASPASASEPAPIPGVAHRSFTSSDGVRLHYLDAGSARPGQPVMVFIPGWSMPAWIWNAQIEYFALEHRVIAFDPRGQGRSAVADRGYVYSRRASDIAELLQATAAPQVVLVGWSLAVLECLQALSATARPDLRARVRGLVLVDNSVGEGQPPGPPGPPSKSRYSFAARLRANRRATVDGFVRSMFKTPQPKPWLDQLTEAALRLPLQASIGLLNQPTPREFWRDALYALEMPVLYVNTPRFAAQGELAHAQRSTIQAVVFEDAGHALFVDEAPRFNALLAEFLGRLPPPAQGPR